MLTAFVPAQRVFHVTSCVTTKTAWRSTTDFRRPLHHRWGKIQYRLVFDQNGSKELKHCLQDYMDNLSGMTILSIQVKMGNNRYFSARMGLTSTTRAATIQQRLLGHSMSEVFLCAWHGRATNWIQKKSKKKWSSCQSMRSMMEKASLLTLLKPQWDFQISFWCFKTSTDVLGVISVRGASSGFTPEMRWQFCAPAFNNLYEGDRVIGKTQRS